MASAKRFKSSNQFESTDCADSIVFWNNKGGVGKTTLAFFICELYARKHPEKKVLVIDMCPQSDISSSLTSREDAEKFQQEIVSHQEYKYTKTIAGFLHSRADNQNVPFRKFVVKVKGKSNLYLMPGGDLDLIAHILSYERNKPVTHGEMTQSPWAKITNCLNREIKKLGKNVMVFIDTNPAFTVYTEIAITAARKLWIPINPDDYSVNALKKALQLVYGSPKNSTTTTNQLKSLERFEYFSKAAEYGISRPKVDAIIIVGGNRYNSRLVKLGTALKDQAADNVYQFYLDNRDFFTSKAANSKDSDKQFEKMFVKTLNNLNTVGLVARLRGKLPCDLASSEPMAGTSIHIDKTQKDQIIKELDEIFAQI